MGRMINRAIVATKEDFRRHRESLGNLLYRVSGDEGNESPEVWITDKGTYILVTDSEWKSYLCGGRDRPPVDNWNQDDHTCQEITESEHSIEWLLGIDEI